MKLRQPSNPTGRAPTSDRTTGRKRRLATAASVALTALAAPALSLVGAPPAQAAAPVCIDQGLSRTCTYTYTGGYQSWLVPDWVTSATFQVVGAAGGQGRQTLSPGGAGASVTSTIGVTPSAEIRLFVGGKGASDTGTGGWNGGGNGAGIGVALGGGGGGASDVRIAPYGLSQRVLVAGGGGGSGSREFQNNAGIAGSGGSAGLANPGGGVGAGLQGLNSTGPVSGGGGFGGSTSPGGGGGGSGGTTTGCSGVLGTALGGDSGSGATGGAGGHIRNTFGTDCYDLGGWGGGGGGGWSGGGGGGAGLYVGAGGGGGSSMAPAGNTSGLGALNADGVIKVTYLLKPTNWEPLDNRTGGEAGVSHRPGTFLQDLFTIEDNANVLHRTITNGVVGPVENLESPTYPGSPYPGGFKAGSKIASVSWSSTRIDIFAWGRDDALWHRAWNGGWAPWERLGGVLTSSPTVSSNAPGDLDVFMLGTSSKLWQLNFTWGVGWTWTPLGNEQLATAPAAAAIRPGTAQISVFAGFQSASGYELKLKTFLGSGWTGWQSFYQDPVFATSAPAVSASGYRMSTLVWRDAQGISESRYNNDTGQWWKPTTLPALAGASTPAVNSMYDTNRVVFVTGPDNIVRGISR